MSNPPDAAVNRGVFRVSADLVVVQMPAASMEEVITRLAGIFVAQGYVKPSYTQSALDREATCPTGLPTPGLGTAIPHGGVEHTLKPGIAVATLAHPVEFGQLGDPESRVPISIVFLLSVTQPETQVYLLQALVEVYKDEASLRRLYAAAAPGEIAQQVNAALQQAGL
jgi:galactitol PTS system EIIA component